MMARTICALRIDLANFLNAVHNLELALRVGSAIFEFSHHVAFLLLLFAIKLGLHTSNSENEQGLATGCETHRGGMAADTTVSFGIGRKQTSFAALSRHGSLLRDAPNSAM